MIIILKIKDFVTFIVESLFLSPGVLRKLLAAKQEIENK